MWPTFKALMPLSAWEEAEVYLQNYIENK